MNNNKKPGMAEVLDWYRYGWDLFKKDPLTWGLLTVIWSVVALVLFQIPLLGPVATWAITPAIYAGYLYAAKDLGEGRRIGPEQLFRGLRRSETRMSLLTVGAITLLIYLLAALVLFMDPGTPTGPTVITEGPGITPVTGMSTGLMVSYILRSLLMVIASVMGVMSFIYACPAIIFKNAEPIDAVMTSMEVAFSHLRSTVSFMLVYTALCIPAALTAGLGFMVLLPVSCCAAYAAYRAIFPDSASPA